MEDKNDVLKQYNENYVKYYEFTNYMLSKIKVMLIDNNIRFQSISSRIKQYDSLNNKLTKSFLKEIKYDIKNIYDIAGIRIIFYNRKDIDKAIQIIYANDEDFIKVKFKEAHYYDSNKKFIKYDAKHLIIESKKIFNNLKVEIQLVDILSHSCNEIGHDIFYKDVNKIEKNYKIEFDNLLDLYKETRNDAIKLENKFEVIKQKIENILNLGINVNRIISEEYIGQIRPGLTGEEANLILNDFKAIASNLSIENIEWLKNKNIIELFVNMISGIKKIKGEGSFIFDFYNDYKNIFRDGLEVIGIYIIIDPSKLKYVIEKLKVIIDENDESVNLQLEFKKFLEKILKKDKGRWQIHNEAYEYILNCKDYSFGNVILTLAKVYINQEVNNFVEVGLNQFQFSTQVLIPGIKYKNRIKKVINKSMDIIIKTNENINFNELVHSLYIRVDTYKKTKREYIIEIYKYFLDNYESINSIIKYALVETTSHFMIGCKSKVYIEFINKLNEDYNYIIILNIFSWDMTINKKYRKLILKIDDIIKGISESDTYLIENIHTEYLNSISMNINIDAHKYFKFMYRFASDKMEIARIVNRNIFEKTGNFCPYITLGILSKDLGYLEEILLIDNFDNNMNLIKAIKSIKEISNSLIDRLIEKFEHNLNYREELLKSIIQLRNESVFNYLNQIKEWIKGFNLLKKALHIEGYFRFFEKVLNVLDEEFIDLYLENLNYSDNIMWHSMYEIKFIFEKYPDKIRKLIENRIIKKKENMNLDRYLNFVYIETAKNYSDEFEDNIEWALYICGKYDRYLIWNWIENVIGKYKINDVVAYLIQKLENQKENINFIDSLLIFCETLDENDNLWDLIKEIVSLDIIDEDRIDKLSSIFETTGVVSGKDGFANAYKQKKDLISKDYSIGNSKLKKFISKENEYLKSKYDSEMLNIQIEEEFKIQSYRLDDNINKEREKLFKTEIYL